MENQQHRMNKKPGALKLSPIKFKVALLDIFFKFLNGHNARHNNIYGIMISNPA